MAKYAQHWIRSFGMLSLEGRFSVLVTVAHMAAAITIDGFDG